LQRILIFSAGWILLAFLYSGLRYFLIVQEDHSRPLNWKNVFNAQAIIYGWAILSPLIIFFAKRFRFEQRNWWRLLPAHLVAAVVFLLLHTAIHIIFVKIADPAWVLPSGDFLLATLRLTIIRWAYGFADVLFSVEQHLRGRFLPAFSSRTVKIFRTESRPCQLAA
jgi:hypothetical protein